MAGLNQWSSTPASNASVGSINFAEGQNPSTVNNSARQLMADVAAVVDGTAVLTGWGVEDAGFIISHTADATKKVRFSAAGLSAGTTRTLTVPNASGTLAFTSDIPTDYQTAGPILADIAALTLTQGDLLYSGSAGSITNLAAGTVAQFLKQATAGPVWAAVPADLGASKAWVRFDGTGTLSVKDSFNVTSVTDNGTGDYTVNFTTPFANANYAFNMSASGASTFAIPLVSSSAAPTGSAFRFVTFTSAGAPVDAAYACVAFFGVQ
jgi:hypothetical protein